MKLKAIPGKQNFGLYKYEGKKKDTYFVRREQAGKEPLHEKLGAIDLNEARREGAERVREWLGLKPKSKEIALTKELWPKWFLTKLDKAQATRDSIENSWKHLEPFFGGYLPSEITTSLWEEYIEKKRKTHGVDRRFANDCKWLSMFLIYLHRDRKIDHKPVLRNPDPKSEVGKYVPPTERQALLLNANEPTLHAKVFVAATTGMRKREIEALTTGGFDESGKPYSYVNFEKKYVWLRIKDTKIRKSRYVPMPEEALEELSFLAKRAKSSGGIFLFSVAPTFNCMPPRNTDKTAWTNCRAKAKVTCRFHDLRHSYLTDAFKAAKGKVDSMLVCAAAGLSIEEAQATYLHFDVDDLRIVTVLVTLGESQRTSLKPTDIVSSGVKAAEISSND